MAIGIPIVGFAFILFVGLLVLLGSIFWIWMLVDCVASNRPGVEKLLWFILIFCFHLLGALLYFLVGRQTQYRTR
jgi:hypothetical protein